jgi:hypothetical protein
MTHPLSPIGCIVCGSSAVIASISVERNGILAHYPTCWAHIDMATRRVAADAEQYGASDAVLVHRQVEALDDPRPDQPHSP